jgi:hypothetical protein
MGIAIGEKDVVGRVLTPFQHRYEPALQVTASLTLRVSVLSAE